MKKIVLVLMLATGIIGQAQVQAAAKADILRLKSRALSHDIQFTFATSDGPGNHENHKVWVKAKDRAVEDELNKILNDVEDIDIRASDKLVRVKLENNVELLLTWQDNDELMMSLRGNVSKKVKNRFNGIYELGDININIDHEEDAIQLTIGMNQKN